jgi:diaminopimelate decarboxylase
LRALDELSSIRGHIPVRHWLSLKSQPLRRLVKEWQGTGRGIEVVSEFELQGANIERFAPSSIIVNGVAKHRWLSKYPLEGLRVNFDSLDEVRTLAPIAKRLAWHVGLRFAVRMQFDIDEPAFGTQFGFNKSEAKEAVQILNEAGIVADTAHFHLMSNVASPSNYVDAITEIAGICAEIGFSPRFVDCGGGLPCPGDDLDHCEEERVAPVDLSMVLGAMKKVLPKAEELWLENGRFLTGRAGVLVLTVVDVKERPEGRYLLCDGGRTNHAIVSDWERHNLFTVPQRYGTERLTTICGPTCMAFDRICRMKLPEDVTRGDLVVWQNAGAYHIPWETRFSHGWAPVIWIDDQFMMSQARDRETFSQWWSSH